MGTSSAKKSLDQFGETLVREVRDETIEKVESVLDGRTADEDALRYRKSLAHLSKEDLQAVKGLVAQTVDLALFQFLWMLESNEDIRVSVGATENIAEASDGLTGELWGTKGWIARFTKARKPKLRI